MSLFFLKERKKLRNLDCMVVDVGSVKLIMPIASVAEVIHIQQPREPGNNNSPWLYGQIEWREKLIPFIDFEALSNQRKAEEVNSTTRILVLNSLKQNHSVDYFAIATQGFPHTVYISEDESITFDKGAQFGSCTQGKAGIKGEEAFIPDFDKIDMWLAKL